MSGRVLRFTATADALPSPEPGVETIVLDTAWTPPPGGRPDVRPLRPLVLAVLRERDPLAESMRTLDAWAAASSVAPRLEVDDFSWWYRRRLVAWRGLHERLVWRWVLGALAAEGAISRLELDAGVPELREVAELSAPVHGWMVAGPVAPGSAAPPAPAAIAPTRHLPWPIGPILWRLGRHPAQGGAEVVRRRRIAASRSEAMRARLRDLGREPGRLLVVTAPATNQALAAADGSTAIGDPFLGPIADQLHGTTLEPVLLEIGTDGADDEAWSRLASPGAGRILPGSILARGVADAADEPGVEAARRTVEARLATPFATLDADGVDFGPWVADGLRSYAGSALASDLRQVRRIGRLLEVLRPAAVLMVNEYSRPEWLIAAAAAGVPVVAVQHGIIHPLHAGYILPTRDGLTLATRTHVFGEYEARLLTRSSVYREDEVAVTGAPRHDLVPAGVATAGEREAVRASLGVRPDERMVVFSSTSSGSIRGTTFAAALDTLLDGPWPGVHLVVKLHPAEPDVGYYAPLIEGMARARGFEPPRLTVVKSVDLYQLLRASDAHLGVSSTVLTDAVAAGARNLIVTSLHGTDLIGYVAAGVARPVRNAAELLAELDRVEDPDHAAHARAAFLADHFAPGPSGSRIARDLLARYAGVGSSAPPERGHPGLVLRPVTPGDAAILLDWANEPTTRAAGFHPDHIGEAEHAAWLAARLASPDSRLFIGLDAGRPVGQVRLERTEDGSVEVSISVAREERGRGVGSRLLDAAVAVARAADPPPVSLIARVRPDNEASMALFRRAGFEQAERTAVEGIPCEFLRRA